MAMKEKFTKHGFVIIDMETLGKWDDSIILSIGLTMLKFEDIKAGNVTYESLLDNSVEFKLDVADQRQRGRTHTKSVLDWWKQQGDSAREVLAAKPDDMKVDEIFPAIEKWLLSYGVGWKNFHFIDRNNFDVVKLQHLWEVTLDKLQVPWDYCSVWEVASMLKWVGGLDRYGSINPYKFEHPKFVYHSAKCDAALDGLRLYDLFKDAME